MKRIFFILLFFLSITVSGQFSQAKKLLLAQSEEVEVGGYGLLYNWWVAKDSRGFVSGWHLPTIYEHDDLRSYIGNTNAGGKLKEIGTTRWNSPNIGATNAFGFTFVGGGTRAGVFSSLKLLGTIFLCDPDYPDDEWTLQCLHDNGSLSQSYTGEVANTYGFSIRLIKDATTLTNGQTGTVVIDGRTYNTICIGTQEWLSENLQATHYANGNIIPNITDQTAWDALTTGAWCVYNNDDANR